MVNLSYCTTQSPEQKISDHRRPLGSGHVGLTGIVACLDLTRCEDAAEQDLERLLLEIGFIEGTRVEILHQGPFGGDPLAIRVGNMRVAIRRHHANAILIDPLFGN